MADLVFCCLCVLLCPRLPGTYATLDGPADHEAAIRQFTPDSFPQEWIPLMAQQMAQAPPSRCVCVGGSTWGGSGLRVK